MDYRAVARKPEPVGWAEVAAIPLVGLTAWEMLVEGMQVKGGEGAWLIVNGVGGVGLVAIQLARNVLGVKTVIANASRPETVNHVRTLGATHTISHRSPLKPQIDALGLEEVKYVVVLATITKDLLDQIWPSASSIPAGRSDWRCRAPRTRTGGSVKHRARVCPSTGDSCSPSSSFPRRCTSPSKARRSRSSRTHGRREDAAADIVTRRMPLTVAGLREAHEFLESGKAFGKIVLGHSPGLA